MPGNPLSWHGWLDKDLVSTVFRMPQPENHQLTRSMHVAYWSNDDHGIRFQFGINNSDFPNPIRKKEFVLDFDCYSTCVVDPGDIEACLYRYEEILHGLFEECLNSKIRKLMSPVTIDPVDDPRGGA